MLLSGQEAKLSGPLEQPGYAPHHPVPGEDVLNVASCFRNHRPN
jgi:hypothetical protein